MQSGIYDAEQSWSWVLNLRSCYQDLRPKTVHVAAKGWPIVCRKKMGTFLQRKDGYIVAASKWVPRSGYQDLLGNRSCMMGEPPSRGTLTDIHSEL